MTEVEFIRVVDKRGIETELHVMVISVKGQADRQEGRKFVVKNLVPSDGEYNRDENGDNTIKVI